MKKLLAQLALWAVGLITMAAWGQVPSSPGAVELRTPDGTVLKATYFAAAKPGPGVLLLHQSNRDRKSWAGVAAQLASAGINALTVDMRGYGESGGTRAGVRSHPEDVDAALEYLRSQPGVDPQVIGLGGAGYLGVNHSVEAARRHPQEIKSLVLMSGEAGRAGSQFLHQTPQLPELFVFSDEDEYPPTQDAMKLLYVTASSPSRKLVHYSAVEEAPWLWEETPDASKVPARGGHGTDMFQAHLELPGIIVQWFVTTLIKTPGHAPADTLAAASILNQLEIPGRAEQVKQQLLEARNKDPQAQLWPEVAVGLIAEHDQNAGDIKSALEIYKLNLLAYPDSADANDNVADAYLADGEKDLARQYAEKTLALLDSHKAPASSWSDTQPRRAVIRSDAEDVLKQLDAPVSATSSRPAGTVFRDCPDCPEIVVIPAGNFTMGSSAEEKAWASSHGGSMDAVADEAPQHQVALPSFALGKYDVTRGEYAAFIRETGYPTGDGCGAGRAMSTYAKDPNVTWENPGFKQTDRDPVVCVSWKDANAYVAWLNGKSGHAGAYRLPSESEWEYAARAGTSSKFWWGDDVNGAASHAWFRDNSDVTGCNGILGLFCTGGQTHPVGAKPPNTFGLYDMAGNAWQWTEDCYDDTYASASADGRANETPSSDPQSKDSQGNCLRVDRGGSWMFPAWLLRPATRERNPADYRDTIMGFRVARTLPAQEQASPEPSAPRDVPAPGSQFRDCSDGCPEMVMLPQGSFVMGAPSGEEERENVPDYFRGHSVPQHLVTIRYRLAIAKFDVTRDEYAQFVAKTNRPDPDSCYGPDASGRENDLKGANWRSPGFPQTGRDPVVCVSWDDAQAYVAWLSAKTGHVYRLPTEAEWEYAAREGTTTARYFSASPAELCRYVNHADVDYSEQNPHDRDVNRECRDGYAFTSPVGSFPPNEFGLYDMLGNAWQWTEDCWNDNYNAAPSDGNPWQNRNCGRRVVRGGAFSNVPGLLLSAVRGGYKSSGRDHSGGFRVARTLP